MIVYLALAYGLAWAAQVALIAVLRGLAGAPAVTGVATLVAAPALMWPPAIGAFVARRWVERSGFADAGLRWPRPGYIALAWLGPPVLTLGVAALSLSLYPLDRNLATLHQILD
ncbi:hypothetical protein HRbin26_01909 [bacterium HR26]|nr:hypothetical protein HRbin26_01909 [bacterium HR26]